MRRILTRPSTNAICISLFTGLYSLVFMLALRRVASESLLYYRGLKPGAFPFWAGWCGFLAGGYHAYIVYVLIAVTALVVILLLARRHPYDEYHTALLMKCLAVAIVLTLIAIAVFYLLILSDPSGMVVKFTLFIVIHWATVVLADLVYVLLCRWS